MNFKERLMTEALPKAVEYYNSGLSSDEAIAKTAESLGFNVEQTDRLSEFFNTAKTINFYKTAEDRTKNFELADKNHVHEIMFKQEKKAEATAEYKDYSFYTSDERSYLDDSPVDSTEIDKVIRKVAEDDKSGYTVDSLLKQGFDMADTLDAQADFVDAGIGQIKAKALTDTMKIAEALMKGYSPEEAYAKFKAACKSASAASMVEGCMPEFVVEGAKPVLDKIAEAGVVDSRSVGELVRIAEKVGSAVDRLASYEKRSAAMRKRAQFMRSNLQKIAARKIKPPKPPKPTPGPTHPPKPPKVNYHFDLRIKTPKEKKDDDKDKDGRDKEKKDDKSPTLYDRLPAYPKAVEDMRDYVLGGLLPGRESLETAIFGAPSKSTYVKDRIDNVRRSVLISDLYQNDPILSEADPNELARAYQSLVQTSPKSSLNKEVVRAILRQAVASPAISPYDAKSWADLDAAIAKATTPAAKQLRA